MINFKKTIFRAIALSVCVLTITGCSGDSSKETNVLADQDLSDLQHKDKSIDQTAALISPVPVNATATQFEEIDDRRGVDDWENDPNFPHDVFTFVRVKYSDGNPRWRNNRGKWRTDYPDSDLNFSFRLQQLTSMKVNPDPIILELTDKRIFDYPFLYLIEPGDMALSDAEAKSLRHYLDNGGFLMIDDFWGEYEYDHLASEMKNVFPKRDPVKLKLDHPIFHCVYDLKEIPQVPSLGSWQNSGLSFERADGEEVSYRAIFDDKGRMSVIICHNTDLGDGWEREGMDKEYFKLFSERLAYPMGINIVFYAMTH